MSSLHSRPNYAQTQTQTQARLQARPPRSTSAASAAEVWPASITNTRAQARAAFISQLEQASASTNNTDTKQQTQLEWKKLITSLLSYDINLDQAVMAGAKIAHVAQIEHIQDLRALMRMNDTFVMGVIADPLARLQGAHALPLLFHALRCIEIEGADGAALAKLIGQVVQTQPDLSCQILLHLLGDTSQIIRRDAVWAMSFLPEPLALPPLMAMLRDSRREVRVAAVNALKYFHIPPVIDALILALRDWESEVRCAAALALGWVCEPRTFNALAAATTDQDPLVRSFVHDALQKLQARWPQPPTPAAPPAPTGA